MTRSICPSSFLSSVCLASGFSFVISPILSLPHFFLLLSVSLSFYYIHTRIHIRLIRKSSFYIHIHLHKSNPTTVRWKKDLLASLSCSIQGNDTKKIDEICIIMLQWWDIKHVLMDSTNSVWSVAVSSRLNVL